MAVVAKRLTHLIVVQAFVGSIPICRPIKRVIESSERKVQFLFKYSIIKAGDRYETSSTSDNRGLFKNFP